MTVVRLRDIDVNYEVAGDGPTTLVLVSGLADDLHLWDLQMDAFLNAGLRVVRYDNRGIGATSKPPGPYTTAQFAADLQALVDHLALSDFHLAGISMGGMIAQEYALARGDSLASVVLACTYAAPGPFCSRMYALWADMAPVMGPATIMRDVALWGFTPEFFEKGGTSLDEVETAMRFLDQPVSAYLAQLESIRTHDTRARLAGLTTPTLTLAGERDILIPVELSRRLHEALPNSTFALVPGGHCCLWEEPEPFARAIVDFVTSRRA
jgi:pimeloyl-ACP methyl ester carboxylesterase